MEDKITFLSDEFQNGKTGELVQGVTIIIDGKLKEMLDMLIKNNDDYNEYTDIIRDALFSGINSIIKNNSIIMMKTNGDKCEIK